MATSILGAPVQPSPPRTPSSPRGGTEAAPPNPGKYLGQAGMCQIARLDREGAGECMGGGPRAACIPAAGTGSDGERDQGPDMSALGLGQERQEGLL